MLRADPPSRAASIADIAWIILTTWATVTLAAIGIAVVFIGATLTALSRV